MTDSLITCAISSGIFSNEGFRARIPRMPKPVLTSEHVHWIRTSGLTDAHMARTLGVGYVTVHNARRGISFKEHATPPDTAMRKPGGPKGGIVALPSDKNCGVAALDDAAVHFIRTSGLPDEAMASMFGVSYTLINRTRRGLVRKDHATPPDRFHRGFGQKKYVGNELLLNAPTLGPNFTPKDRNLYDRLRMWCALDADGCWIWTGCLNGSEIRPSGNPGATSLNGVSTSTHRAMWIAVHGEIPDEICICHTCDKPPCIHPFHLWPGTHLQNMRDSMLKGRHVNVRGRS